MLWVLKRKYYLVNDIYNQLEWLNESELLEIIIKISLGILIINIGREFLP